MKLLGCVLLRTIEKGKKTNVKRIKEKKKLREKKKKMNHQGNNKNFKECNRNIKCLRYPRFNPI